MRTTIEGGCDGAGLVDRGSRDQAATLLIPEGKSVEIVVISDQYTVRIFNNSTEDEGTKVQT